MISLTYEVCSRAHASVHRPLSGMNFQLLLSAISYQNLSYLALFTLCQFIVFVCQFIIFVLTISTLPFCLCGFLLSKSSSSSTPISEHSRLHKLTPLRTILCMHPRCVETKVMGPKVMLYCTEPCPPWSTYPVLPIRSSLMAAQRMREWSCDGSALVRCPTRRSRLFAITEVTGG